MTWSEEGRRRATEIIARYPDPRSAVMPLLYLGMREEGYVTEDVMRSVGELVGMTAAQVQSVASFYTMYKREPVGRYLVSVCTSISCMLQDADEVMAAVEEETGVPHGETDEDGTFSVEHVECLGACGGAPAVQVDYELVEGVSADQARELIRWLRSTTPDVVLGDEMQHLFGGARSFDWAIADTDGAVAAVPAFGPYRSAASGVAGEDPT